MNRTSLASTLRPPFSGKVRTGSEDRGVVLFVLFKGKTGRRFGLLGLLVAILGGCSTHDPELEGNYGTCSESAEELYETAAAFMHHRSFKAAASGFAKVQTYYPYSKWATQAQLMEAYCRYHIHQYEDAIDLFSLYVRLHPNSKDIPYAQYMIGLAHYERISIVERDQSDTQDALEAFQKVVNFYSTSPYAKDARFKINFIRDHMAAQEMSIGRFYQRDRAYTAALNRFKNVITNYPTSASRAEALLRLMECYGALHMDEDLEATYAVLKLNHKDSVWEVEARKLLETIEKRKSSGPSSSKNGTQKAPVAKTPAA